MRRGRRRCRWPRRACLHCQGAGTVKSARGHMVFSRPCAHCGGTGRQRQARCPRVRRPAGGDADRVADRSHCRPGSPTARGCACRARATPAATAARRRSATSPCRSSRTRCFGATATICTSSCRSRCTRRRSARRSTCRRSTARRGCACRPGTQSGQRFRLRERGAPSPRDGRRGDLVVEVRLVLPTLLDERSKELLREFGRINGERCTAGADTV